MNTARRWYIYLVCAINLQALAWAVIALLRNLLAGGGGEVTAIAFQIASIIVTLPLFIVHWLWAQRLAARDVNEHEASLRGIYHYGMMGGFLGAGIANTYTMLTFVAWVANGRAGYDYYNYHYSGSTLEGILYNLIAIIICGVLWFYQKQVLDDDLKSISQADIHGSMRRFYTFVFSAWGVTMTTMAVIHVIRWIMYQFGDSTAYLNGNFEYLSRELVRLLVGVPLWLLFWRSAQAVFSEPGGDDRESVLRKFYLYATVFIASLTAVTNATGILAGLFRRILGLDPEGDIRTPLPVIIGMGLLWFLHVYILKEDASVTKESPEQGGVRRLYQYLIAGVGLAAFFIGVSGDLSVLIRSVVSGFNESLREALAWFTAALIAGLPVWFLPWRHVQNEATELNQEGVDGRRSLARRIYLYFYLFIATMTVLSGAIYILFRVLSLMLGERGKGDMASGIAQAVAYVIVGVLLWIYHGSALRGDGEASRREQALRLKDVLFKIVDAAPSGFGQALLERLQKEEPDLNFELVSLQTSDVEMRKAVVTKLNNSGVIVGPWTIGMQTNGQNPEITQAVVNSKAHKILFPEHVENWDLAGVDSWNTDGLLQQTVRAVKQWAGGEEIKAVRPMGVGGIIGTAIGVLILLLLLAIPLVSYFVNGF